MAFSAGFHPSWNPPMLDINQLSEHYHVCGQVQPSDVVGIAGAGYTTLVCMRPDDEVPGQPRWAEIQAEAKMHGLGCHFIPARSGAVTPEQAMELREVLARSAGPVLAYCASGNRCTLAWRMAPAS
ncbi:TPA: TIGR01244 family phosphatase [Pseudomonas aeruginosa]|nr:TIGR01244 family phosphatase [Pseudomonas aeruginosa]